MQWSESADYDIWRGCCIRYGVRSVLVGQCLHLLLLLIWHCIVVWVYEPLVRTLLVVTVSVQTRIVCFRCE